VRDLGYSTNRDSPHKSVFSRAQRATYSRRNAAFSGVSGRGGRSGSSVRIMRRERDVSRAFF
jgi:hypothetical protein